MVICPNPSCLHQSVKRRERDGVLKPLRFSKRNIRYRLADILKIEAEAAGGAE